jgi:hypothetical protein
MNTIKFTNPNIYNTPQTIILTKNNKTTTLNKVNYTKDLTTYYKINNHYYA